ncbi:MAG: hypothetical protein ABIG96_03080 [Candidatus Micrarchaeota archaeon]
MVRKSINKFRISARYSGLDPEEIGQEARFQIARELNGIGAKDVDGLPEKIQRLVEWRIIDYIRKHSILRVNRRIWNDVRERDPVALHNVRSARPVNVDDIPLASEDTPKGTAKQKTESQLISLFSPEILPNPKHRWMLHQKVFLGRTLKQIAEDLLIGKNYVEIELVKIRKQIRNRRHLREAIHGGISHGSIGRAIQQHDDRVEAFSRRLGFGASSANREKIAFLLRAGVPLDFFRATKSKIWHYSLDSLRARIKPFLYAGLMHRITHYHILNYDQESIRKRVIPRLILLETAKNKNIPIALAKRIKLLERAGIPEEHHRLFFMPEQLRFSRQLGRYWRMEKKGLLDFAMPSHFTSAISDEEFEKRMESFEQMKRSGLPSVALSKLAAIFDHDLQHPLFLGLKFISHLRMNELKARLRLFRNANLEDMAQPAHFTRKFSRKDIVERVFPQLRKKRDRVAARIGGVGGNSIQRKKIEYCKSMGASRLAQKFRTNYAYGVSLRKLQERLPLFIQAGLADEVQLVHFLPKYSSKDITGRIIPELIKRREQKLTRVKFSKY